MTVDRLSKAQFRRVSTWANSLRSSCDRLHTATTLWTAEPENRLLAAGYNGAPSGLSSCDEEGHLMVEGRCVRTNHGEENALLQCRDFDALRGGTATILGSPCYPCARKLVSVGVKKVEYIGLYHNARGGDLVEELFRAGKCERSYITVDELINDLTWGIAFSAQQPGGMLKRDPDLRRRHTMNTKGIFIVFEGGEGSGKSTQVSRLKWYLAGKYGADRVVITHEPGGGMSDYRQQIFDIRKENPDISPVDLAERELELFEKDRALHVANLLRPKKDAGCIVLCDRFMFSTIAYQGYARGMDLEKIRLANAEAIRGFIPDLVILMDFAPEVGLARKFKNQTEELTPFEKEKISFHQKVREGFLAQAAEDPDRWIVINATQDRDTITKLLIDILQQRLAL